MLKLDPVDLLVFAPHPDDEVIGCAGVIQRSLASGKSVRIVFSTNGDGYPKAASVLLGKLERELTPGDYARLGETRQREAIVAAKVLGVDESSLVFLGYPDGSMAKEPAQADFSRTLRDSRPAQAYVTDGADEHLDHRVTHELVSEAAAATGYSGELFTFIVHSGGDVEWPTHGDLFESRTVDGVTYPTGVSWPPPIRFSLTARELEAKLLALKSHASQWTIDHDYLGRFVKSEEIFWPATNHR